MNNIPNRIKQPSQCCSYCGKSYIKKTNLERHLTICELLQRCKKSHLIIEDDEEPLPSQRKMFQMLIELGQKYSKLEEQVEEINKWVVKKKKKINMLDWLNTNIKPTLEFANLITSIIVTYDDIEFLLEHTFIDTLNVVFERTIYKFNENDSPIFAFFQKTNAFYIYDENTNWIELSKEILIKFLNKVHMKIFKCFYDWKKTKANEIKSDDHFATNCDKTLVKLTSIIFEEDGLLSKVRSIMYSKMKTNIKALVEYEFEF
jgi:hypothetical protein